MNNIIKVEAIDCRLCKISNTHQNWKFGDKSCPITCTRCVNGSLFEYIEFQPLWEFWNKVK